MSKIEMKPLEETDEKVFCPKCNADLTEVETTNLTISYDRQTYVKYNNNTLGYGWNEGGDILESQANLVECSICGCDLIEDWENGKLRIATGDEIIEANWKLFQTIYGNASSECKAQIREILLKERLLNHLEVGT